ncbi:hypothetical protein FACS1894110_21210 [Spirochaetia bacterium]|nr:hypothetical protein FACS1894110_21210 [Spirochaetia bacterium]
MTEPQCKSAIKAAIETITRLIQAAPDWGECGLTLTIHSGDVKRISETCTRTLQPGADHA